MQIHQILASGSPGDAVTNTALRFQEVLREVGPSGVFARYVDPRVAGKVSPLEAYEAGARRGDLLIYHLSIGEPEVVRFLLGCGQRLVLVYHNIAPAEYFTAHDPTFAGLLASGRRELLTLRERVTMALAVSHYNAEELRTAGFGDVRVSPLPIDPWALHEVEPDPVTSERLRQVEGPLVLFVGQILPHKRPDLLLHAYQLLVTAILPDARLAMLGPPRLERYHRALKQQAQELNLHQAMIPGWLRDEEVAAFYRHASVFATMSEHEGVCVPLLEAMSFEVPVVARAFAAIPETMGDAGLLLPPDADAALVAEALGAAIADDQVRKTLIARGRARVADFNADAAVASFLNHLSSIA